MLSLHQEALAGSANLDSLPAGTDRSTCPLSWTHGSTLRL